MDQEKKAALRIIIIGLAFGGVAFVLNGLFGSTSPRVAQALSSGIVFGNAIGCWGCIQLARAKGYAWYVGLVGIFSCVGLAILTVLKDKVPVAAAR